MSDPITVPTNPFQKCYDKVLSMMMQGANNPLVEMIKPGNVVNYGTLSEFDRNITKDAVASADMPELRLIDEGGNTNFHANSSGAEYKQSLTLICQTGDMRYGMFASRINWYILCNFCKDGAWKTALSGLTWNGTEFIKNIDIVPIQIGMSNPERGNGIAGWTVIWRMIITMRIANVNLVYTES